MHDPAEMLESYRQHAHRLLQAGEEIASGAAFNPTWEQVGTHVLAKALGTRKPTARAASRTILAIQQQKRWGELNRQFSSFHSHVVSLLKNVSVKKPNLTPRGNSHVLVQKFLRTRQGTKPLTRLRQTAATLDGICAMDLVHNSEIPAYLQEIARDKALQKRREREARLLMDERGLAELGLAPVNDRAAIEANLKHHPEVAKTLLGAVDALAGESADGPRQASASARNALERLVHDLTGEDKVKSGLAALLGESHAKAVGKAYDALSAAVHGPAPGRRVAEFNVRVVLASCILLVHAPASPAQVQ